MKLLFLIKTQLMLMFLMVALVIIPQLACIKWLPNVPYTPYFFLLILACLKFIVFDENSYQKSMREVSERFLKKYIKKKPSQNQIFLTTVSISRTRDIIMMITALVVLILGIIFERF